MDHISVTSYDRLMLNQNRFTEVYIESTPYNSHIELNNQPIDGILDDGGPSVVGYYGYFSHVLCSSLKTQL
jgi:hypothetical protein